MLTLGENVVYFSSIKVQQSWFGTCMWFCSFQCVLLFIQMVPDNDNMEVFGMYCNILSMLIGNAISDPLPNIWQVFLHVSTILNGSQTMQLSLHSWLAVRHAELLTVLWEGWLGDTCTVLSQCGFISRECFWAQIVTPGHCAEGFEWVS